MLALLFFLSLAAGRCLGFFIADHLKKQRPESRPLMVWGFGFEFKVYRVLGAYVGFIVFRAYRVYRV